MIDILNDYSYILCPPLMMQLSTFTVIIFLNGWLILYSMYIVSFDILNFYMVQYIGKSYFYY